MESLQDGEVHPLAGVRLLDLTHHVCGGFAARLLADHGAEVIKVERPNVGDPTRCFGPFPGAIPNLERSGMFQYLNANKRGVTLNLKTAEGRDILSKLAQNADIVITDFRPRTAVELGISFESLTQVGQVMTSVTSFGLTGPYRDFEAKEINVFGFGGPMRSTGTADREPVMYAPYVSLFQASYAAALATLLAHFAQSPSGEPLHVDFAITEALLGSWDRRAYSLTAYQYTRERPAGRLYSRAMAFGTYPCADGYVILTGQGNRFPRVLRMIGREELIADPRFSTASARADPHHIEAFEPILIEWLVARSRHQVWLLGQKAGVLVAPVLSPTEVLKDPHYRERDFWSPAEMDGYQFEMPGAPFVLHGSPRVRHQRAPRLGEHNGEVFGGELGMSESQLRSLTKHGVM